MQHFYFDHNATSSVAPGVLRQLPDLLSKVYGNASSIHHFGQGAKQKLESSRRDIASRLGCEPREIVFTSGGTESNNLAVLGVVGASPLAHKHVVTTRIEHPAVLNACAFLEQSGSATVTYLSVDEEGIVNPAELRSSIRPETVLVSVMHANNETGALQPVEEIADIARNAGVPFHSDGVQVAGRMPLNLSDSGIDLYAISGHKFGAPKGTGLLYLRKEINILPRLHGGHHERDRRAGTENVPGAASLAIALAESDWKETAPLRDRLERGVLAAVPGCTVNAGRAPRLPNTTNICFRGIEGEAMVIALDLRRYAVSSGSACSSGAVEPSHVLLAMGLSREDARSSVRFSLGPSNTREEVEGLIEAVQASAAHLRRLSPQVAWETLHV